MNNLDAILEIALGLVLTWLILSVATVEIQDIINKWLDKRAKFLETAILDMFRGEQEFVDKFYEQPAIKALYKKNLLGKLKKPDHIPNAVFAEAVFEIFVNLGTRDGELSEDTISLERIIDQIEEINAKNKELGYFLRRLLPEFDSTQSIRNLRQSQTKITEFKTNAETWFDASMTKASKWYAENAKSFAFVIGLVLAISFNVDSVLITKQLWREPTLRQSLIAQAQIAEVDTGPKSVAELGAYYEDLKLPVGWGEGAAPTNARDWRAKALGWFISALAAMQGAPFWFGILGIFIFGWSCIVALQSPTVASLRKRVLSIGEPRED